MAVARLIAASTTTSQRMRRSVALTCYRYAGALRNLIAIHWRISTVSRFFFLLRRLCFSMQCAALRCARFELGAQRSHRNRLSCLFLLHKQGSEVYRDEVVISSSYSIDFREKEKQADWRAQSKFTQEAWRQARVAKESQSDSLYNRVKGFSHPGKEPLKIHSRQCPR